MIYYLPLSIAEARGYFKDEGLDVSIADFAGGSKALQAVVGGSADVVSAPSSTRWPCSPRVSSTAPSRCRAARP